MQNAQTGAETGSRIDWSLLAPMLLQAMVFQLGLQLARITTTYSAIDIELSVFWIGVITACYALLPAIFALKIGRFTDRHGDMLSQLVGTGLILVACVGLWLFPSAPAALVFFNAFLGLGLTFCMTGQQSYSVRCAGKGHRDSVFGYYMLAVSLGQAIGPLVLSYVADGADIPPIRELFGYGIVFTGVAFLLAIWLYYLAGSGGTQSSHDPMPLGDLLRVRGLLAMAVASALVVTALEMTIIYLPVLGAERAIDASTIGYILAMRAAGSITARAVYGGLVRWLGRIRLMFLVMLGAAVALVVAALPAPIWVLSLAVTATGFFLAIASTAGLAALVDLSPPQARGAALAVRQTCNRGGQFVMPMIVGLVASMTGAGAVFVVLALAIGVSGIVADRAVRSATSQ